MMSVSIPRFTITLMVAATLHVFDASAAVTRLVNMVPNSRSGETNQDSEPTITVDPNDYSRMAGTAFTWDNLTGAPMVGAKAPLFVSTDRGATWTMAFIVPSKAFALFPTGDITTSFSATLSGAPSNQTSWLYAGTLSSAGPGLPMTVLRAQDPFSAATMTTLDTRTGNVDQPHTLAATSGAQDRLFVGFNNGYSCKAPQGKSSTFDVSQDATVAAPTFTLDVIESRITACQDGFAQVPAAHANGTVYGAFIHDWNGTPALVVVRDDNWASGASPFTALVDSSDNLAGRLVLTPLTLPSGFMGQNRLGASNVSIAVDPHDSDRVYVAWTDSGGPNKGTVHVRRSINAGVDWSADLLTVTNALNPQVAINSTGIVGVLYQQLASGNWETHFVRTTDPDATTFDTPGVLLAKQDYTKPLLQFHPYIGDYASLTTAGWGFVGMFSASNYPDKANFLPGVQYQREVDWNTHKLYADAAHTAEVPISIDPFFFEVQLTICDVLPGFCDFCKFHPLACFPIYDPLWRFKCPQCEIEILINPGDEVQRVVLYDESRRAIARSAPVAKKVAVKATSYGQRLAFKPEKGKSYVLVAETKKGARLKRDFNPDFVMRAVKE